MKFRPYGLHGGQPGRATRNFLVSNSETTDLPSKVTMSIVADTRVVHEQAGGGGFGDPLGRDPEQVAYDVWNHKISADFARERHGVIVDGLSGVLDSAATDALRRQDAGSGLAAE